MAHARNYPWVALFVVSSIALHRSAKGVIASGGKVTILHPWRIEDGQLAALGYKYRLPIELLE